MISCFFWFAKTSSWVFAIAFFIGAIYGYSREQYKANTDEEVYEIIDDKRQDDFDQKNNYIINDCNTISSPNDIQIGKAIHRTKFELNQIELKVLRDIGVIQPDYLLDDVIETALTQRLDLAKSKDAIDDAFHRSLIELEQRQREYQNEVDHVELNVRQAYRRLQAATKCYETQTISLIGKDCASSNKNWSYLMHELTIHLRLS